MRAEKMGPMNSGLSTRIILLGPREFRERSEGIIFRKLSVHNRDSATAARGTGGGYIYNPPVANATTRGGLSPVVQWAVFLPW